MLTKLCKCGSIIPATESSCVKCRRKGQKDYDTFRRKNYDVYHNPVWRRLREACKQKFSGLDIYQLYKYGRIVQGSLAHHIIEVEEDMSLAYTLDNLIWVSDRSHKEIHSLYAVDKSASQQLLLGYVAKFRGEG